jgi:hypothetical protein
MLVCHFRESTFQAQAVRTSVVYMPRSKVAFHAFEIKEGVSQANQDQHRDSLVIRGPTRTKVLNSPINHNAVASVTRYPVQSVHIECLGSSHFLQITPGNPVAELKG